MYRICYKHNIGIIGSWRNILSTKINNYNTVRSAQYLMTSHTIFTIPQVSGPGWFVFGLFERNDESLPVAYLLLYTGRRSYAYEHDYNKKKTTTNAFLWSIYYLKNDRYKLSCWGYLHWKEIMTEIYFVYHMKANTVHFRMRNIPNFFHISTNTILVNLSNFIINQ